MALLKRSKDGSEVERLDPTRFQVELGKLVRARGQLVLR